MKRLSIAVVVAFAVATAVVVAFLLVDRQTFVDGYPVGDRLCPEGSATWWCDGGAAFAQGALNDAEPGHSAVATVEAYVADYRAANGSRVLRTYGTAGGDGVFVLRLADDTVRAFYLSCFAGPWGPRPSPSPNEVHCGITRPDAS